MEQLSRDVTPDAPTEGAADSFAPGTLVAGRFRLAAPVARTAETWLLNGIDERTRRRVRLRFSPEPPLAATLDLVHPSLPRVVAHGVEGPSRGLARYWVALDWVDGAPLSLDASPPDTSRTRRRTVIVAIMGLLDALERLHEAVGPHGALALSSVWLGDDGRLHLVDATAPPREPSGGDTWTTPEMLRDLPRTVRTDVYAVGSLLVGWLSGRPPFGKAPAAARAGHLMRPLPPLAPTDPPLRAVVERAMSKRADDRYPSAAAFREALAEALREVEPIALPLSGGLTFPAGASFDDLVESARPRMPLAPPRTPTLDAPVEPIETLSRPDLRPAIASLLIVTGLLGLAFAWVASLIVAGGP